MDEDCSGVNQAACDFDLTSFMFGNIDESGQLEDDDLLDSDTKKYLASLSKFGFSSMVTEVIGSSDLRSVENGHEETNCFDEKSPTAQDFFDIDELADETSVLKRQISECDYDSDSELGKKNDFLKSKRLETPLAAMLPTKYENVDVTTLFPDFRVGKVIFISYNIYFWYITLLIFLIDNHSRCSDFQDYLSPINQVDYLKYGEMLKQKEKKENLVMHLTIILQIIMKPKNHSFV